MLGNSTDTDVESNTEGLCVIVALSKAHSSGKTSVIHGRKLIGDDLCGEGHIFQLSQRNFLYIWENKELSKEKIRFGSIVKYRKVNDTYVYGGNTKFRRQNVEKIQMDLEFGESAFKGIKDAFPNAEIADKKGIYMEDPPSDPRMCLIGMKFAVMENERIIFGTRNGEQVNLKLNCRENLQLSISPVVLQIRDCTDDDDVGDVALVKFSTSECGLGYQAVCEGLILRHKAKVISIDEEPVKIVDQYKEVIPVPGNVKFDTGNDAGTAISLELVEKLGLEPNRRKKIRVTCPGDLVLDCYMVKITLIIRKRKFKCNALVGATAPETDLLIGMDIIARLNKKNYTLGK